MLQLFMVPRERLKAILVLALPIIGGMISQNIFNLVDTAMVGFLGNAALAAVGLGGFATFCANSLVLGLSAGVQAIASRRKGEGDEKATGAPLNGGLILAVVTGGLLSAFFYWLVPIIYPYLNNDPEVMAVGIPYLRVRVCAITFVGCNMAFRGYWNANNLSGFYLRMLIIMHATNIFLNFALIFGQFGFPELGVYGAGLGTTIATLVGTATYFYMGLVHARKNGFLSRLPSRETMRSLVAISLPSGVQSLFFAAGFTVMYWIIGKVGTPELAVANVLINVVLTAVLPGIGLGLAAATFVGQALGRKDIDDAKRWGWDVVRVGVVLLFLLGLPMVLVPEWLLSLFVHEPETLALGVRPMQISGLSMTFEAVGLVFLHTLQGAGDSKRVMTASITLQWLVFLPCAYLAGPVLGYGLFEIWLLYGGYRLLFVMVLSAMWHGERWTTIRV